MSEECVSCVRIVELYSPIRAAIKFDSRSLRRSVLLRRQDSSVLASLRFKVPLTSFEMAAFVGRKYKLDKSENFDEYMKELGVGLVTRKMGNSISPTVELIENNGEFTLKTTSTFKNSEIKFKLGEEFDEETIDGRNVKSVITRDGNKFIQIQKGDKQTTIEREFTPTELKAVMKLDDIICTRVYKVVE